MGCNQELLADVDSLEDYIPKGTSFKDMEDKQIRNIRRLLNNRPRKSLDFQSPNEVLSLLLSYRCTWYWNLQYWNLQYWNLQSALLPFRIFIVPLHRNLARSIAWFAFLGWGCSSKWIVPWCNGNTSDSGSEIEDSNSSGTTWADSKRGGWCRYTSLWGCSPIYYNVASFLPWVRCVFYFP